MTLDETIAAVRGENARKDAIAAWAATRDRVRLKVLSVVYRGAPDAALRALADEAERAFSRDAHAAALLSDDMNSLNNAASSTLIGDRVRAVDHLNAALQANPTLKTDPVVADFAALLLGIPAERALELMTAPGSENAFSIAKGAQWWDEQQIAAQHINGRTVARNIVIYLIVTTALLVAWMWVNTHWQNLLLERIGVGAGAPPGDASLAGLMRAPDGRLILIALLIALGFAFDLLARGYLLHLFGSITAESRRKFTYFLHHFIPLQGILIVAALGVACILLLVSAENLANASIEAAQAEAQTLGTRTNTLTLVLGVTYVVLVTRLLMDVYRLSVVNGCLALLVASAVGVVVLAVILVGFGALFGAVFSAVILVQG